jgi:hypothetical protein
VTNLCCFAASRRIVAVHQYRSLRRMGWEGNSILREATASTPRARRVRRTAARRLELGRRRAGGVHRPRAGRSIVVHGDERSILGVGRGLDCDRLGLPLLGIPLLHPRRAATPPPLRAGSKGAARSSPARQAPGRRLPRSR